MSTATMTSPWKQTTSNNEGGDYERPKPDLYPACLVAMIDLGTHQHVFNGEKKTLHMVRLVWELVTENDSMGRPFKVALDFTLSLNVKAKLRHFLEAWEGRKYGADEPVDLESYLGKHCMLNLTASGKEGKYVDVDSVTKFMKGLRPEPPSVQPFIWTFEGWDPKAEPPIPEWVPSPFGRKALDEIKKSPEWSALAPF
jgi:hypothetical protein